MVEGSIYELVVVTFLAIFYFQSAGKRQGKLNGIAVIFFCLVANEPCHEGKVALRLAI